MSKRKYQRWVECFGDHNLSELCDVARKAGCQIVAAVKPGMCTNNTIVVFADSRQMRNAETTWVAAGHRVWNRRNGNEGGSRFPIDLNIPRDKWVDDR